MLGIITPAMQCVPRDASEFCFCRLCCHASKSAFREQLRQTLTYPDKFCRHKYVGQTQMSRVKILAAWAKRCKMAAKKVRIFVTGTMNSLFFVTGQISVKFGQNTSIGVFCWTLIEEFWKFFLKGVILPQNSHFWLVFVSQTYRSPVTFLDLAKRSIYYRNSQQCVNPESTFCATAP